MTSNITIPRDIIDTYWYFYGLQNELPDGMYCELETLDVEMRHDTWNRIKSKSPAPDWNKYRIQTNEICLHYDYPPIYIITRD
ncbi:hypothetical protein [Bacteroides sp.]|uniref:hypothetical protein n=1 Tax=Bacteroides sp. TaxID=29523 RepID=UPI00260FFBEB|nr:hypothetical protein [Bacteroides sp.]MDD3039061.1 hypothetical protein [Bacteroides sp.]